MAQGYEQQFRSQGFAGKEYDDLIKNFVEQYKESAKEQAEFNVKAELVLDAILAKEDIKVADEEIEEEAVKMTKPYNLDADKIEEVKKNLIEANRSYLENSIKRKKVVDMIVESAKLIDKIETEEKTEE
jgi:trigger factor